MYFKGNFCVKITLCSQTYLSFMLVTFESVLWLLHTQFPTILFQVSCRWCGIHHGTPSMRLLLSTSDIHPGISLRNKNISTLRSICINDIFSLFWHRFTSLTSDQNIWLGVRHQIIWSIHTQEIVLGYLRSHWHQWWSPSYLLTILIIDQ